VIIVLLAGAIALLALPCSARRYGRRLHPQHWAQLIWAALMTGSVALEIGLVFLALPTALRAAGVSQLAAACNMLLGHLAPGSAPVGWAAGALALAIPWRAALAYRRARLTAAAMSIEAQLGHHEVFWGHELVVLPTPDVLAYSVQSGTQSQIVVSSHVVDQLSAEELIAVLVHEHAHLQHGHQRRLVIATLLERTLVPLRRCTSELRLALERWADEEAATHTGRPTVRRALVRLVEPALATAPLPAFTDADTVVERIDALGAPPTRAPARAVIVTRAALFVLAGIVLAAAGGWLFDATRMLHRT